MAKNSRFILKSCRLLWFLVSPGVLAGDWAISPSISVDESYTDNVRLAPEGQEEEEFVTQIRPRVSIRGTGARLSANIDYIYELLYYGRHTVDTEKIHTFQGDANAEVIESLFYIDTRATLSKQNVDGGGVTTTDNVSASGNRTSVSTISFSPYLLYSLGSYADAEARYTYSEVSTDGATSDSNSDAIRLSLSSGRRFTRAPWDVVYSREKISRATSADSKFERIDGIARYRINRKISALVGAGYDRNRFQTSQGNQDGARWRVGGTWTPNARTSLELGYLDQVVGSNLFMDFSYRKRRSIWTASFSEDVSTTRSRQLNAQIVPLIDAFGEPITDPNGRAVDVVSDTGDEAFTDETFVSTSFVTNYTYQGERTTFSTGAVMTERNFQISGDKETVVGANANVRYRLSRKTTASLRGSVQQFDRVNVKSTRLDTSIGLVHNLARNASSSVNYRHLDNDSDNGGSQFTENRLTVGLQVRF